MKYQKKTNEFVDVLKVKEYTSIESILDFVCDCTISGIQINSIMCLKESNDNYYYVFMTKKTTHIAYYKKNQYIVKTYDNEIEIYNKDKFIENFTTIWEYE